MTTAPIALRHSGTVTVAGPFRLTPAGLEVAGEPTFEDWKACGSFLQHAAGRVQWWVGDWLNYGERRYGETYREALGQTGMDYQTLRNTAWVCGQFELSRRRDNLSFKHHAEVAALPADEADALLARAEAGGLSTRQVRALAQQAKAGAGLLPPQAGESCTVEDLGVLLAAGAKFGTVYADPPWRYGNQGTRAATDNHYPTMTVEEIAALPVGDLAADLAHLWLWTTNGFLFECPRLFAAWGFEFKSSFVWVKPQMGIGNYLRNSHELLLLATRGGLVGAARDVKSWGEFDRTAHSAKPEKVRAGVIERVSPGPYLELFGRRPAEGWTVWGNQIRAGGSMFDAEPRKIG